MKKAILVTLYEVCNYGTALQAYASQKVLEQLNIENEILNYKLKRLSKKNLFVSAKEKKSVKGKIYSILSVLYRMIPNLIIRKIFSNFRKEYLVLTKDMYDGLESLKQNYPNADVYITGSDQVWNSEYNTGIDRVFFLDFLPKTIKKISYAASIGMDDFREKEKQEIKKLLSSYTAISVREKSAQEAIEKLGLEAKLVVDPTLLLNKEEWKKIATKRLVKEKYLLLYILGRDKNLVKYAEKIASQKGLKIVKVGLDFIYSKKVDRSFSYASPNEFLSLFLYSDYVVTNSFHGLSFATNFHKQLAIVLPKTYSARLTSFLEYLNLEDRIIYTEKDCFNMLKTINYNKIEEKLNKKREESMHFLINALEKENNE